MLLRTKASIVAVVMSLVSWLVLPYCFLKVGFTAKECYICTYVFVLAMSCLVALTAVILRRRR